MVCKIVIGRKDMKQGNQQSRSELDLLALMAFLASTVALVPAIWVLATSSSQTYADAEIASFWIQFWQLCPYTAMLGLILGIFSLVRIKYSNGMLRGIWLSL